MSPSFIAYSLSSTQHPGGSAACLGVVFHVAVIVDGLTPDEAAFEVCVDHARAGRGLPALRDVVQRHFLFALGKVAGKAQRG